MCFDIGKIAVPPENLYWQDLSSGCFFSCKTVQFDFEHNFKLCAQEKTSRQSTNETSITSCTFLMLLLFAMTDITLRDCQESSWDGLKNGEEQKCKSARVLWHRQDVVLSNFIGCSLSCVVIHYFWLSRLVCQLFGRILNSHFSTAHNWKVHC